MFCLLQGLNLFVRPEHCPEELALRVVFLHTQSLKFFCDRRRDGEAKNFCLAGFSHNDQASPNVVVHSLTSKVNFSNCV